jgi:hypothetical protein
VLDEARESIGVRFKPEVVLALVGQRTVFEEAQNGQALLRWLFLVRRERFAFLAYRRNRRRKLLRGRDRRNRLLL